MASLKRNISDILDDGHDDRAAKRPAIHDNPDIDIASPRLQPSDHHLVYPSTTSTTKPVSFQQPTPLLTFSYDQSRTLSFTDSALRYYVDPPHGAELRYGYERWIKRPEEKGRIDGLLKAISRVKQKMEDSGGGGSEWLRGIGIVSWRGVMTKILTAPYEDRDGWEMNVMQVDGTLYLEEHVSDAKLIEKEDMKPHHRLQSYYGYSFEAWSTSSRPDRMEALPGHPSGWGGDVNTSVQWCSVVKTKLGDTRMVIGGEVDCVRDKFSGQTTSFVELKTSLVIRGPQDEARFEKKLLKFYFQSFLLGVPIVVGFRTPSGQLTTVQSFKTIQIPRLVRGKPGAWDPTVCLDWGDRFLRFLRSVIQGSPSTAEDDKGRVWRAKFNPRAGVTVSLLDETGVSEVVAGEDRVGFLPRWYWDELRRDQTQSENANTPVKVESVETSTPKSADVIPPGWQI
ncbi:RAI1-domain-containing protein [Obba rivulosa]|uniref:Decapping nuclease n=1 Tax=Obba rivulosa TaxID=1052685 RepID=A0A8E2DMW2_9APHY|nr:RAI1-domain-containing protein [Obba rivulosa]